MIDRLTSALFSFSRRLRLAMIALMLAFAVKTGAAALSGPEPASVGAQIDRQAFAGDAGVAVER